MARRMLINALYPEECRVAVIEDDTLIELEVERADHSLSKGNIYKAPITRIEPSLQAAFLDIGSSRNGFLQINDINPSYFSRPEKNGDSNEEDGDNSKRQNQRVAIQDGLRPNQNLVVQVVKDERAAKGATLTTNISIPGRYLVLMVGNQRGGVSRKIVDEGQRKRLRQAVQSLKIPVGMGVIVRTAGINKSSVELQRDLDALVDTWVGIVQKSLEPGGPIALYKESNLSIRTIRDYLTPEIEEILIDSKEVYENARDFVSKIVPNFEEKVTFYDKPQPLFSSYHLDAQIEETNQPEVILPSGGSIVINITEAIVAVDVNSGRSTGQSDVEQTAFETNKEAAEVIAKQLRLRDLGGLVVIDFIDMVDKRHKQVVEKALKDAVRTDKAKIEVGRISKFGLLEMSRQRLKSSLNSQSHMVCPHCTGRGRVKTSDSAALEALRKIQSSVFAGGVDVIKAHMSPGAALMLLNDKRAILADFEERSGTRIIIFADGRMKPEQYELELVTSKGEEVRISRNSGREERESQEERRGNRRRGDSSRRRSRGSRSKSRRGSASGNSSGGSNNSGSGNSNRNSRRRGSRNSRSAPREKGEETNSRSKAQSADSKQAKTETKPKGRDSQKSDKSEKKGGPSKREAAPSRPREGSAPAGD
jgi:ribonuclease E